MCITEGPHDKDRKIWSCIAQQLYASTPEPFLHGYVVFTSIKYLEQRIYLNCKIIVWKKILRTNSINLHAHMKPLVPQTTQSPKLRRITLKISLLCSAVFWIKGAREDSKEASYQTLLQNTTCAEWRDVFQKTSFQIPSSAAKEN